MNEYLHHDFAACDTWDAVWHLTAAEPPPRNTPLMLGVVTPDGPQYLAGYLDDDGDWRTHDKGFLFWYDPNWIPERWALLPPTAIRRLCEGAMKRWNSARFDWIEDAAVEAL